MVFGCDFWQFFFFSSLGGFCGGCFLWWLLFLLGLEVFLMGFGGWHGSGMVVSIAIVVVVAS